MAEPFLSQIEAFPFGFAPRGWAICAGQLLPINQNQALFALIGTYYGGNGTSTFALPDLRGRVALAFGQGVGLSPYVIAQQAGEEAHTLTASETPTHTHTINAANNGTTGGTNVPSGSVTLGAGYASETGSPAVNVYSSGSPTIAMGSLGAAGGQAHENRMPYLALNYCIALQGVFPTQN
jgi:microcystin-dependent protein